MRNIFIFGASRRGEILLNLINDYTDDIVLGFIDNNMEKVGKEILGITIISLEHYLESHIGDIVIASMYHPEIEKQLMERGLKLHEDYKLDYEYLSDKICLCQEDISDNRMFEDDDRIILTLPNGDILGGLEKWSKDVYWHAAKRGQHPVFFSFTNDKNYCSTNKYNEIVFNRFNHNIFEITKQVCLTLLKYRNSILFLSYSLETLMAIRVLERYGLNENLKAISVVHIDHQDVINYNLIFPELIHSFLCVSEEIRLKLLDYIPTRRNDIYSRISPISGDFVLSTFREYSSGNKAIQLGYASRLEDYQKRSSDLLELCDILDANKINYTIEVAGSGSLEAMVKSRKNIVYRGKITHEEIKDFWGDKDIFLSFSDTEGTSLSMLEAMSRGVIPIVTKVSGVKALINDSNGKLIEVGDIAQMAQYIIELYQNRNVLPAMGEACINMIKLSCDEESYYNFLFSL